MSLPIKVRFLNFFRNVFRIPPLERWLSAQTRDQPVDALVSKLVPNPYQYPKPSFRTVERDRLRLKVDVSDYIGHYLYFGFADNDVRKLFSLCQPGMNVMDVGANIGWTALNLAKISGTGTVLAFEPDPYNFKRCKENADANQLPGLQLFNLGLGSTNTVETIETRTASNLGGNRINKHAVNGTSVNVVRADTLRELTNLKISLIKIDVEGYELHVLQGAHDLLKRDRPTLYIELDDSNLRDQGHSARELVSWLTDLGYRDITRVSGEEVTVHSNFSGCHYDIIAK